MKHFKSIFLLITLGFAMHALLAVAVSPAYAAGTATSPLTPLNLQNGAFVISGLFDKQNTTFSGALRLSATGGAIDGLKLLSSDLNSTDITPPVIIDSGNVAMTGTTSFKDGDVQDERITVMNVIHPGTYKGDLILVGQGQKVSDALTVPLMLQITIAPDVQAPAVSIKAVHEQIAPDKGLITWFIPDSADNNNWIVLLTNQGPLPVTAKQPRVVLTGDRTGMILTNDQVTLPDSTVLPPHQTIPIHLTIKPDMLPPDHYKGTILFQFDGFDTTLSVSMELNVRYGPFWPLIVILLGIVLGRLAVNMKTPFAQKQLKLMDSYYLLNAKIRNLQEYADPIIDKHVIDTLSADLKHIHERIESSDAADTEDSVTQDISQLKKRIQFFSDLRIFEDEILHDSRLTEDQKQKLIQNNLAPTRDLEVDKKDDDAQKAYVEAQKAYQADLPKEHTESEGHRDEVLMADLGPESAQESDSRRRKISRGFADILAFLSGTRIPVAELRYWVARPLLALFLLVLLVLIGLQTLYVNSAMFGAAGVFDYLGLLLWGFGTDVTQRTLLDLKIGGH